jgi:hypothetical protein
MRTRIPLLSAMSAALIVMPSWLQAQAPTAEDAAHFDATVRMMANATPEVAEATARDMFNDAYTRGQQQKAWAYAVRGYGAASRLPNLSQAMRNQLAFWHGYALFQEAMEDQAPESVATAQASLTKFQEARDLVAASGGYPTSVNVDTGQLLDNIDTYIQIQQAIIRRGR